METAEAAEVRGEAGADEAALVLEAALSLGSAAAPRRSAYTIFGTTKLSVKKAHSRVSLKQLSHCS